MDSPDATTLATLLGDALVRNDGVAAASRRAAYDFALLRSRTREVANGLLSLGVEVGEPVAVVADPTPEALYVELAILAIGATSVVMRPEPRALAPSLASPTRVTIVGDRATRSALGEAAGNREVYVIDDPAGRSGSPLDRLAARGIAWEASRSDALASRTVAVLPTSVATDGGRTHGAWVAALRSAPCALARGERVLLHTPLHDPAGRLVRFLALTAGATLWYATHGSRLEAATTQTEPGTVVTSRETLAEFAVGARHRLAGATGLRRALSRSGAGLRYVGRGAISRSVRTAITAEPPDPETVELLASIGIDVIVIGATIALP